MGRVGVECGSWNFESPVPSFRCLFCLSNFENVYLALLQAPHKTRTMGCFFGCFRVRDVRRPPVHLLSQQISSAPKDPVDSVARNHLSSLLLFEAEDRDQSPCQNRNRGVLGSADLDINSNELKAEAKFLKACGTLPHTPAEIRNKEKLKELEPHDKDTEPSPFHSWFQNASIEKLKQEKSSDQQPSPIKLIEEWENGPDSSSQSPDSCVTGQTTEKLYTSYFEDHGVNHDVKTIDVHGNQTQTSTASFTPRGASMQCRKKSVNFDCEIDASLYSSSSLSSEVTSFKPKPSGLPCDNSVSKPSPYPTPPSLTNDMQTPGTVYPIYSHNRGTGKNPRIRSQYVCTVMNPVENAAQLKKQAEETFNSEDFSAQLEEYIKQVDKENPESQVDREDVAAGEGLNVDTSLSSWLPPKQPQQGSNKRLFSQGVPEFGRTPGDRPILGMVAAHWNTDEAASSLPKWWDGNGIPNSTNKYKEDQKVKWHATPFEERLEKALSEDKLTAQRKQLGKVPLPPIDMDDKEECTLQPSSHFESSYILINSS